MNIDEKRLYEFTGCLNGISVSGIAVELSMPQANQLHFHDTTDEQLARGTIRTAPGVVTVEGTDEETDGTSRTSGATL